MHGLGRRQRTYHGVISVALLGALLGGSDGDQGLLGSLGGLLGLGGGSTPTASTGTQPGGSLHFESQKLRKGCQRYTYSYQLSIPQGDDFDLEIFVTDRRGVSQGSDVILSGADPVTGVKSLTICRSNTVPGAFTLHGTLYTNDGAGPTTTTALPDDMFRLTVPKHKAHTKAHKHKKRHR